MHGTGRIERYDLATGAHVGTFASGLPPANCLLIDDAGRVLVSTGNPGEAGVVLRIDPRTKADGGEAVGAVEVLIDIPEGYGGRLHRATGMAWLGNDLLVASQGDGKVKRYAYPSGEWMTDAATASPGGITQIAVHEGRLYVTDFVAKGLRRAPEKLDGAATEMWAKFEERSPWGLAFGPGGAAYWSTTGDRVLRTAAAEKEGLKTAEWAGAGGGVATPLGLAVGPDGRLYVANWTGGVSAWSLEEPSVGKPLREWTGPEVKGPLGLAFTTWPRGLEVKYAGGLGTQASPEKLAFFETKVRPLLHAKCIDCHGEALQEGGLRLDTRAGWERGGRSGVALLRGKPEESLLAKAVRYADKDLRMPPDEPLSASEAGVLVEWIRQGAIDPREGGGEPAAATNDWDAEFHQRLEWWSLQPLSVVEPPAVTDPAYARSDVDRFIRAGLERAGLTPAPRAEFEVLLRRLAFVLTGLPPTPEFRARHLTAAGVDAETAYRAAVEELLASPQYGERFARHWMDVVRYTDTYGYEWDNPAKGAYEYRDYLVRAYNADIGFDTLLREQIAGDLLPTPRVNAELGVIENLIGPMFHHMGEHRHGSSLAFNGIHQEMVNNKIDAFSKAFLATTVACARCHDHKLEAVSQKDYYALGAVFMTPRWVSRVIDDPRKNAPALDRLETLRREIRDELAREWMAAPLTPDRWSAPFEQPPANDAEKKPAPPLESIAHPAARLLAPGVDVGEVWKQLMAEWSKERQARLQVNKGFTVLADFAEPKLPAGWVLEGDGMARGWVDEGTPLVALEGERAVRRLLPRGYHTHALSSKLPGALRMPPQHVVPGAMVSLNLAGGEFGGSLTYDENSFQNETISFFKNDELAWRTYADTPMHGGVTRVAVDFATASLNPNFPPRTGLAPGLPHNDLGYDKRSWLGVTGIVTHDSGGTPRDTLDAFATLYDLPAPATRGEARERLNEWMRGAVARWGNSALVAGDRPIVDWLLATNSLPTTLVEGTALAKLVAEYRAVEAKIAFPRTVNGMDERENVRTGLYFNVRGNVDALGELVTPDFLSMFAGRHSVGASTGSGRLELVDSLLAEDHPLTARVYANRVWQWVFGAGLVTTPDDFGHLGDTPSHPELLDALARSLRSGGWSTKRLVRELVLSETFRQSGRVSEGARERDPANRLRHHMPTRRLEAEAIRDALLAVSGRLDPKIGGRPINPPRPVEDSQKRLFSGPLDGGGRRSLYLTMSIMQPPEFLTAFDLPDLKLPTGRRNVTSVPAQTLLLLNDPLVALLAEHWADALLREPVAPEERLVAMFVAAYGREPSASERERWLGLVREFAAGSDPATDQGAWAAVAHALFNTREFTHIR